MNVKHQTPFSSTAARAVILAAVVALASTSGFATPFTVAGFNFDNLDSAVAAGFVVNDPAVTSTSTNTQTFDAPRSLGRLMGGSPDHFYEIASAATTNSGREIIQVTFTPGVYIENGPGDDFVVLEQGSVNFPEGFGVAVRRRGDAMAGGFRYEFANGYEPAPFQFVTAFDLTDFGFAAGEVADAVQICNLHSSAAVTPPNLEDCVDNASGQGNLVLNAGPPNGTTTFAILQGPASGTPAATYTNGFLDADMKYVCGLNPLVQLCTMSTLESDPMAATVLVNVQFTRDVEPGTFLIGDLVPGGSAAPTVQNLMTIDPQNFTFELVPTMAGTATVDLLAGTVEAIGPATPVDPPLPLGTYPNQAAQFVWNSTVPVELSSFSLE